MNNLRFARIRLVEFKIIVRFKTNIIVVCHIVVHALYHVVARRTKRKQLTAVVLCVIERAHGGQFCGNLVAGGGINRPATLPVFYFFHFHAKRRGGCPRIFVEILCLRSERATGIITYLHFGFL